jgi:hypothetical protein
MAATVIIVMVFDVRLPGWCELAHCHSKNLATLGLTLRFWAIHSCESCHDATIGLILSLQSMLENKQKTYDTVTRNTSQNKVDRKKPN